MKLILKFANGEMGLARTYWLGYVLGFWVLFNSSELLIDPNGNAFFLTVLMIGWGVFSGWAVIKAAHYKIKPNVFGWLAIVSVFLWPAVLLFMSMLLKCCS